MREVDAVRDIGAGLAVGEISSSESISEARRCSKLIFAERIASCDSSKLQINLLWILRRTVGNELISGTLKYEV